jgi:hypothetical protein
MDMDNLPRIIIINKEDYQLSEFGPGYGDGNCHGSGFGNGSGDGDGNCHGYGLGYGDGNGYGNG